MKEADLPSNKRGPRSNQPRIYRGSRLWEFNVYGAIVGGLGGGVLMVAVALLVLWMSDANPVGVLVLLIVLANLVGGVLLLYPGNWVAYFPYAVEVDPGAGLRVFAPYKEIYIPIHEIRDVRKSFLHQGFVVRLRRRRGLLREFVIHWFFGPERKALAEAIRQAIEQGQAT